jgi:hypothetical protein
VKPGVADVTVGASLMSSVMWMDWVSGVTAVGGALTAVCGAIIGIAGVVKIIRAKK